MRKALVSFLLLAATAAAQHPRDKEIHDHDTLAWWHTTELLSGDKMEGRDTGSAAYQRAADLVAKRFAAAGLKPAGDNGTYFQQIALHELSVTSATLSLVHEDGSNQAIPFLTQFTLTPTPDLAELESGEASVTFRGYCGKDAMADIAGKIVVCFGTQRAGLPAAAERAANARAGKAAGIVTLDDPYFTIEPPRWPAAYARSVALGPAPAPASHPAGYRPFYSFRLADEAFPELLAGTGQDAAALLKLGGAKQPLPSFDLPLRLQYGIHTSRKSYSSPNILAILPGSDPALAPQTVVLAAHLGRATATAPPSKATTSITERWMTPRMWRC